jgi:hypothetical protein
MTTRLRCRVRKHKWKTRGRGDALTYVCQVCGKTRDKPPPSRTAAPRRRGCLELARTAALASDVRLGVSLGAVPFGGRTSTVAARLAVSIRGCRRRPTDGEGSATGGELTLFPAVGRWV